MLQSTLHILASFSLFLEEKTGILRIFFLKRMTVWKCFLHMSASPIWLFSSNPSSDLEGRGWWCYWRQKRHLTVTLIASVGTWKKTTTVSDSIWKNVPLQERFRSYTQPHAFPHDEAQWCYKSYKVQRDVAVSREHLPRGYEQKPLRRNLSQAQHDHIRGDRSRNFYTWGTNCT